MHIHSYRITIVDIFLAGCMLTIGNDITFGHVGYFNNVTYCHNAITIYKDDKYWWV